MRRIKYWFQRRLRGFDDRELWSLDMHMASLMLPRFRRLRVLQKKYHEETDEYRNDMANIEYFLYQLSQGEDGWDMVRCKVGTTEAGEPLYKMDFVKDKRFFNGARSLLKHYRKLWV